MPFLQAPDPDDRNSEQTVFWSFLLSWKAFQLHKHGFVGLRGPSFLSRAISPDCPLENHSRPSAHDVIYRKLLAGLDVITGSAVLMIPAHSFPRQMPSVVFDSI
ncbi:hypothetical protein HYDPIDRAFT_119813 [Hydnomerulius pinastri MD-312]|uniref:Uncharacterized protein n=1 Tax=Hydnomerulius pinastri MD-312 TaxID=994086 RepID=A0A0C9VY03_9AGAM|nr:hypothetical protein HYDPIDRAFT_119813 [Hydnomerulius pinastri MD-312]